MNFETVSLLLNWLELGALFAILSRLARTFDLIASTQRELRRSVHHLGDHRGPEHATEYSFRRPRTSSGSRFSQALGDTESVIGPDDLASQSP